ncbi:HD-GYP domain-containing protein, partial [bacterium]|nr:HD-GYP domain-containing protein [bacterium]
MKTGERHPRQGYLQVFPTDKIKELTEDVPRIIPAEVLEQALNVVTTTIDKAIAGEGITVKPIKEVVSKIVRETIAHREGILKLINLKDFDDYTFSHSVNVCLLSVLVGVELNFSKKELENLGLGALLHDIGKIKIPKEILNKPGRLTKEEFEFVKKHPEFGYQMIKEDAEIDLSSRLVIYHHHERLNGRGYPLGLKDEEIHDMAMVTALADVYDALTTSRPYRRGLSPYEAMKIIISESPTNYRSGIASLFVKTFSLYPPGTFVKLNTEETGLVIRINKESIMRPVVRLLFDGKR